MIKIYCTQLRFHKQRGYWGPNYPRFTTHSSAKLIRLMERKRIQATKESKKCTLLLKFAIFTTNQRCKSELSCLS